MNEINYVADVGGLNATLGSAFKQVIMLLSGFAGVVGILFLVSSLVLIVSRCFIFKKLGIAPWKAIIPIYGKMKLSERLLGTVVWGLLASVLMVIPGLNIIAWLANIHLNFNIYADEGFDVDGPDLWTIFYSVCPILCAPITAFSSRFTTSDDYLIENSNVQGDIEEDDEDVDDSDEVEIEDNDEEEEDVPAPVRKKSKSTAKESKIDKLMRVPIYEDGKIVDFEDNDEKYEFISEVLASADYKVQTKCDDNGRILKANFKYIGED